MKFLVLFFVIFNLNTAFSLNSNWTSQDVCNVQADHVIDVCKKFSGKTKKSCLITEMEVQDFFLKKDFLVDSDLTLVCLPKFRAQDFKL